MTGAGLEGFQSISAGGISRNGGIIGVYSVRCEKTGRVYVGSATDVENRIYGHKSRLRRGAHPNNALQQEFSTHGEGCFSFKIVEACATIEIARAKEAALIREYTAAGLSLNTHVPQVVESAFANVKPEEAYVACKRLVFFRDEAEFKDMVEYFLIAANMSASAFGKSVVSDAKFVFDLRKGFRSCSLRVAFQVRDFIAERLKKIGQQVTAYAEAAA